MQALQSLPFPLGIQCDDGQKENKMTTLVIIKEEAIKFSKCTK